MPISGLRMLWGSSWYTLAMVTSVSGETVRTIFSPSTKPRMVRRAEARRAEQDQAVDLRGAVIVIWLRRSSTSSVPKRRK